MRAAWREPPSRGGLARACHKSLPDYEALALKIARDPAMLAALKTKLADNRTTCALFDTAQFTRNVEAAYTMMWQRYRRGDPPDHLTAQPQ